MIARAGRTVSTRPVPARYMGRLERRALARTLAAIKLRTGALPGPLVTATCRAWNRSEQTLRRAVADVIAHPELPDDEDGLSDEILTIVAKNAANLYKSHAEVVRANLFAKSYPTFHRTWAQEPLAVRVGIEFGKDAMRKAMETRVFEVPYRNAVVFLDEMVVPIQARHGKKVLDQLYLLAFLDAFSGEVLVWTVFDTPTTADDTVALFAALIHGRADHDGIIHGGIPEVVITDNAAAFTSDLFGAFARRFTKLEFGRPYTPQDKAKIERKFWTIQYSTLAGTVGITLGAKEPATKRRAKSTPANDGPLEALEGRTKHWLTALDALPSFEQAVGAVDAAVEAANAAPSRLTKRSATQTWSADPTVIRTADTLLLWDVMVPIGDHKLDPRGIWRHGWYRNSSDQPIGASLSVRILPGIGDRVFVGTPAQTAGRGRQRYLATLERNSSLIVGQSDAISARNKADVAKVGRVLRGARSAIAAVNEALPHVVVAPRPAPSSKARPRARTTTRRDGAPVDLRSLVSGNVDLNGPVEEGVA